MWEKTIMGIWTFKNHWLEVGVAAASYKAVFAVKRSTRLASKVARFSELCRTSKATACVLSDL
jgi:hypothetical protein